MEISIKNDFNYFPGIRHWENSDNSAEEFYHTILNKKFKESLERNEKLVIDLDYVNGYAPSFLDESFGNLVFDFTLDKVYKNIEIISYEEDVWIDYIKNKTFKKWEKRRKENIIPQKTKDFGPWFRFIDNTFIENVWVQPTSLQLAD